MPCEVDRPCRGTAPSHNRTRAGARSMLARLGAGDGGGDHDATEPARERPLRAEPIDELAGLVAAAAQEGRPVIMLDPDPPAAMPRRCPGGPGRGERQAGPER